MSQSNPVIFPKIELYFNYAENLHIKHVILHPETNKEETNEYDKRTKYWNCKN